jgi:hypothetical protein
MKCESCEVLYINGVKCHEHGCPDAWKDHSKACFECGFDFQPETQYQRVCADCQDALTPFEA